MLSGSYTFCTTCYGAPEEVGAVYDRLKPWSPGDYTYPETWYTIMWIARRRSPWCGEVAFTFSGSYTYCTPSYRAPDAVYTAYGLLRP